MRKFLSVLALFGFSLILMGAGPAEEGGQIIYFNAADQETTTKFRIKTVVWASDQGTNLDIDADDDFLLEAGDGTRIVGKRAEAAGDGLEIHFGSGVVVSGIKAEDLDGGVVYIIGDRL